MTAALGGKNEKPDDGDEEGDREWQPAAFKNVHADSPARPGRTAGHSTGLHTTTPNSCGSLGESSGKGSTTRRRSVLVDDLRRNRGFSIR